MTIADNRFGIFGARMETALNTLSNYSHLFFEQRRISSKIIKQELCVYICLSFSWRWLYRLYPRQHHLARENINNIWQGLSLFKSRDRPYFNQSSSRQKKTWGSFYRRETDLRVSLIYLCLYSSVRSIEVSQYSFVTMSIFGQVKLYPFIVFIHQTEFHLFIDVEAKRQI